MTDRDQSIPIKVEQLAAMIEAVSYEEVDHHGVQAEAVHTLRAALSPLLTELVFALHDSRVIGEDQKWTIPFGLDCGLEGKFVICVDTLGPDHDQEEDVKP